MAKTAQLRAVDEPNVVLPLASSYNERGVAGYTHTVTNSEDQRKINCFYELAKNPVTGKGTLTLSKRPGVTINASTFGTSPQTAYLVLNVPPQTTATADVQVIFNKPGSLVNRSSTSANTQTIDATTTFFPTYVDTTTISNARNIVLQLRNPSSDVAHHAYFITIADLIANNAWTQITDADFGGLTHRGKMEHMDGFAFIMDSNSLIWNSASNKLDDGSGNSWLNTSFIAKQIKQDRPVGLARLGNLLMAFGEETVEFFFNAGNTTGSPLGRLPHKHEQTGLRTPVLIVGGGTHYYATLGKTMFFIGKRAGVSSTSGTSSISKVFAFSGGEFEIISSPYIEKYLAENVFYSINPVAFHGQEAIAISLSPPTESTQRALLFFPAYREWFEWTSDVFQTVNGSGYHISVPNTGHRLYTFSPVDNWQDDGTSYAWSTQFRLPTNGSSLNYLGMYGVDADTDTSANDLTVSISTNDCVSFSTLGTIDQTQDRKVVIGGGSFRKAHIRLGNTNARPTRIHNFLAGLD